MLEATTPASTTKTTANNVFRNKVREHRHTCKSLFFDVPVVGCVAAAVVVVAVVSDVFVVETGSVGVFVAVAGVAVVAALLATVASWLALVVVSGAGVVVVVVMAVVDGCGVVAAGG